MIVTVTSRLFLVEFDFMIHDLWFEYIITVVRRTPQKTNMTMEKQPLTTI